MTESIGISTLPNGIRVLTEQMPAVRTAAMGIWVRVGSRYELATQHGISHFLEHLFFKGTERRSALAIAQSVDDIGGQMNAFTDREHTVFYVKVLSKHLLKAVEIYADMLLGSALAPDAIERERQVISEEIKMYEDSPDELVQDLFAQTIWNGHALGRSVIGTVATVDRLRREDFVNYIHDRYRPDNAVIAIAGDIEHEQAVALISDAFGAWTGTARPILVEPPNHETGVSTRFKETEQVHLCIGTWGLAQADEARYVLMVLDNILGGGMSSRLFQEIRERRGLVYTITSYGASYQDTGLFVIYAGMSPDVGPQVVKLTLEELEKIKAERVDAAELQRAKESIKGSLMLSLESTDSRMFKLARSELYHGRQITLDELIARIDAVSAEDVQGMASALFQPRQLTMAGIGPFRADGALTASMRAAFEQYTETHA